MEHRGDDMTMDFCHGSLIFLTHADLIQLSELEATVEIGGVTSTLQGI